MKPLSELESSQSCDASTACTPESFLPATAAFRRSQHLLNFTIAALLKRFGVTCVLFVTLTFEEHVRSTKAAQKQLNSLLNAVRERYGGYLWVLEAHASGRIHYHLLIPVGFDCHDGTDLDAWHKDSYPMDGQYFHSADPDRCGICTRDNYLRNSMSAGLRAEDDWWQAAADAHEFGRVQVAPVYGGADAIRKYMIKQDWRTRPWPFKERKNIQFWRCSRDLSAGNTKFSWYTPGARRGREQMAAWARDYYGCGSIDDLRCLLGTRWGYIYLCEMVWGSRPRGSADIPPPAKCPYPSRRYNDPEFCWHPGLHTSAAAA